MRAKEKREEAGGTEWLDAPFANLANEFLADLQKRRKPATYKANRYRLLRALKTLGTSLRVGEVRKLHVAKVEQVMTGKYGPTTISDTITSLQSVFNWAIKYDLLDTNPLVGYDKPSRRSRTRVILPHEFQALLRNSDPTFRKFLISARLTGCRPGELRTLIWEWVDLERGLWILPDHKTITTQKYPMPRIAPLPEPVWKLCRLLARKGFQPKDHVFLNLKSKSCSKDCLASYQDRSHPRTGRNREKAKREYYPLLEPAYVRQQYDW